MTALVGGSGVSRQDFPILIIMDFIADGFSSLAKRIESIFLRVVGREAAKPAQTAPKVQTQAVKLDQTNSKADLTQRVQHVEEMLTEIRSLETYLQAMPPENLFARNDFQAQISRLKFDVIEHISRQNFELLKHNGGKELKDASLHFEHGELIGISLLTPLTIDVNPEASPF